MIVIDGIDNNESEQLRNLLESKNTKDYVSKEVAVMRCLSLMSLSVLF